MKIKILFLFMVILGVSATVPAAGFEGSMFVVDPNYWTTSMGENNDISVSGSSMYVTVSNNLDSITGFDPGQSRNNLMWVSNASASNYLVIKNNSSSSVAANRIITADAQNVTIPPSNTVLLGYDMTSQRWYVQRVPSTALSTYQASPSDPSTTSSGTGVMMGLAGTMTPSRSGKVMIVISGTIDNDTLGFGAQTQIRYGTGTAPTNGAALTGTTAGGLVKNINPSLLLLIPGASPFSVNAIVSGLTLGTAVWADLSLARVTGGNARVRDISISLVEL